VRVTYEAAHICIIMGFCIIEARSGMPPGIQYVRHVRPCSESMAKRPWLTGSTCTTSTATEHAGESAQVGHPTGTSTTTRCDGIIIDIIVGLSVELGFLFLGLALGLCERGLHVGVAAVELETFGVCFDGGGKVADRVLGVADSWNVIRELVVSNGV
jgi:hypothetical protein